MQTQEQFITEQKAKDLDAAIAAAIATANAPIMAKVSCLEAEVASLKAKLRELETGNSADRAAANPGVASREACPSRIPTPVTNQASTCGKTSR